MGSSRLAAAAVRGSAPSAVHEVVSEPGVPLPLPVAHAMGAELGHDFSDVRVHTDAKAGASARAVGATAYTVGRHIAFAPGQYDPVSPAGTRTLRHELVHARQQAGRAPDHGPIEVGPPGDGFEREAGAQADGHVSQTDQAVLQRQPASGGTTATAGTIGANEVLPFAAGQRVLVTNLTRDFLEANSGLISGAIMLGLIPAEAAALIEVILDPKTPGSLEGVVVDSTPQFFKADVAVPALPDHGVKAGTATIELAATTTAGQFDLRILWGTGRAVFSVTARRSDKGVAVSTTMLNQAVDATLTPTATGGVVAETSNPLLKKVGASSLKLVSIEPLSAKAGTTEATAERTSVESKAAKAATALPPRQEVGVGVGVGVGSVPTSSALSAGWRFTFRALGDIVGVPLSVQLDYLPTPGLVTGGIGVGLQGKYPVKGVPLSLSVIPGVKVGASGVGGDASPVFAPSIGVRGAVDLGPRARVFLGYEYFHNLIDAADKKTGIEGVSTFQAGAALRF